MERREHQRFETENLNQPIIFSIDNLDDAEFLDFSQHGLSFSSAAILSVGDRFDIRIQTESNSMIVSALVCNRCKMPEGYQRYGLFLRSKLNEFTNH